MDNEIIYSVPESTMKEITHFLKESMYPTVAFSFDQEKMMADIIRKNKVKAEELFSSLEEKFPLLTLEG